MKAHKRVVSALLFSALVAAAPVAQAQQFSGVIVFGDSLSDAGYYRPVLAAAGVPASLLPILGRFTTAPGPVYAELIASYYGITVLPSNVSGGTVFAQGGARVAVNSASTPTGAAQRPVSTQITEFLAQGGGSADPNALYIVWAGANDLIQNVQAFGAGAITQQQLQTNVLGAATAEIQQIARLQAAGARYVMVFGLPDVGVTPAFTAAGPATAGAVSQLSAGYNTTLFLGLAQAGIRVIPVDAFSLLAEVRANPTAFGFTNITTPACRAFPPFSSAPDSLFCPPSAFLTPDANQTFLFADGIHPTTAAHALIAQFAEAMIDGPVAYSMLAEVPLRIRMGHQRTIGDAFTTGRRGEGGKWSVFVAADRGEFVLDPNTPPSGVDSSNKSVTVGVTARLSEAVALGVAFGTGESDATLGRGLGSFNSREDVLSLFGALRWGGPVRLGHRLDVGDRLPRHESQHRAGADGAQCARDDERLQRFGALRRGLRRLDGPFHDRAGGLGLHAERRGERLRRNRGRLFQPAHLRAEAPLGSVERRRAGERHLRRMDTLDPHQLRARAPRRRARRHRRAALARLGQQLRRSGVFTRPRLHGGRGGHPRPGDGPAGPEPRLLQGHEPQREQGRRRERPAVVPVLKRVFTAANLPEAHLLADLLASRGVRARIFNANASSIAGELPIDAALPQIWVEDPGDFPLARELIDAFLQPTPTGPPLKCPKCGEENPSSFDLCWSCGVDLMASR